MLKIISGEVAEWFKATVSNTVWAQALAGSNPVLSVLSKVLNTVLN